MNKLLGTFSILGYLLSMHAMEEPDISHRKRSFDTMRIENICNSDELNPIVDQEEERAIQTLGILACSKNKPAKKFIEIDITKNIRKKKPQQKAFIVRVSYKNITIFTHSKSLSNQLIEAKKEALQNHFWYQFEQALQAAQYSIEALNQYKKNEIKICPICNKENKTSSESIHLKHLTTHINFEYIKEPRDPAFYNSESPTFKEIDVTKKIKNPKEKIITVKILSKIVKISSHIAPTNRFTEAKIITLKKYWPQFKQAIQETQYLQWKEPIKQDLINQLLSNVECYKANKILECPFCNHTSPYNNRTTHLQHLVTHIQFVVDPQDAIHLDTMDMQKNNKEIT